MKKSSKKPYINQNFFIVKIELNSSVFQEISHDKHMLVLQSTVGTKSRAVFIMDETQIEPFYNYPVAINTDTIKFLIGEENYTFLRDKKCALKYLEEIEMHYPKIQLGRFLALREEFENKFSKGMGLYCTFSLIESIHGDKYWKRIFFNI